MRSPLTFVFSYDFKSIHDWLTVEPDGQVWYEARGGPSSTDFTRVGTYHVRLGRTDLRAAEALAADLAAVGEPTYELPSHGVSVAVSSAERSLLLTARAREKPARAMQERAGELARRLVALVEKSPYSEMRGSVKVVPPSPRGGAPDVAATVVAIGQAPVVFTIADHEPFELRGEAGDGGVQVSTMQEQPPQGFVGPDGTLADGVFTPVRLGAGHKATVLLRGAGEKPTQSVILRGNLRSARPTAERTESAPSESFQLVLQRAASGN